MPASMESAQPRAVVRLIERITLARNDPQSQQGTGDGGEDHGDGDPDLAHTALCGGQDRPRDWDDDASDAVAPGDAVQCDGHPTVALSRPFRRRAGLGAFRGQARGDADGNRRIPGKRNGSQQTCCSDRPALWS
jgi:hypothetical protein